MAEKIATVEKQLVVFNLGQETYAIDISGVLEIIQMLNITRVPGTPPTIEGVVNLRGSVIPVVDLRKRFQMGTKERNKDTRILVVNCKGQDVGVIVDSVAEVLRIPVESIEPSSSVFTEEHIEYLLGIVKLKDRLIILLDMDQTLSSQETIDIKSLDMKVSA